MEFFGKIVEGELKIINSKQVAQKVKAHGNCELVKITVTEVEDVRTLDLNAYLHYVLIPGFAFALRHCGNEVWNDSQAKKIMKAMFLTESVYIPEKKDYENFTRDTSTLSQSETWELINRVIRFCAQHMDCNIKYPGEK